MSYWAAATPATPPPPLPPLPASLERYAAAAAVASSPYGGGAHHASPGTRGLRPLQHPLGVAPGYPPPSAHEEVRDVSPRRQGGAAAASVARSIGGGGGGGRDVVYSGSVVRTPTDPRGVKGAAKLLLIGVTYRGDHGLQLGTAAHEVRMMQQFLTRIGFAPSERKVLVEDDPDALPTRSNILSALRWLVRGAVSGDSLFLHFVGHAGQKVADLGLSTPPAGGGGGGGGGGLSDVGVSSIVPLDYKLSGLVYADELRDILAGSLPAGAKLTCVFDAAPMPDVLDLPHKIVLKGGDSLVTVEGSGGLGGGGGGGDHPAHSEIPSTVNCLTYASETAGVGAGTLTTAFISACNATPLLSYRQLILDAGYIMQREAGAHAGRTSLGPPRPMLASSQPFELTNIFTLGCHGDRGGGAGGLQLQRPQQRALQPPMTPKEEELARRVQYLESQLATPPRSTPAAAGGSRRLRSPLQGGGGGGMGAPYDPARGVPGGADSPPRELVYDSGPGDGKPEEEVSGAAKAVFVDCSYTGSPFEVGASGSEGDADEMSRLQNFLMYVGFNAKVQVLTEASKAAHLVPTRRNILNALAWLVKDARSGDVLFLYYAGFSSAPVSAGDDPAAPTHSHADVLQEALCPTDFFESGFISGDEVLSVLTRSLPKDAKLIVVADVCFSPRVAEIARAPTAPPKGTIVKLPYIISVSPAAGGAGAGGGGGGGGVTHFYDRDADYLFEGPQGRSEIVVLSAHHAENKRGLLTSALLSVWENSAQLCVGIFVSALHAQLLLRCASKDSTAFIQSTQKLYDKNLFFLGNRPQVLKQMKPPARESAQVAPLRQGGAGVAAPADAALRKANTPAGVYLIEDDPARPAAVVIKDADSAGGHVDVTLFSVEGGEVKGTIEPTYADGERTEIAIVLSAQAAPAAASPASPDENGGGDDVGSEGSPGPPESPPPASPEGGGGSGGEAVYTVADRTLRFPDGTTWVKKVEGGDGNAKAGGGGGGGGGGAGTTVATPGAEGGGGGEQEVTPHRRRHATRVVAGATKALLVGVNYPGSPFELATSHEDVRTMQRFLQRQGFQSENRLLLDLPEGYDAAGAYAYSPAFASMPTRTNLVANVRWLCAGAVPGDSLVLFFSGHGDRGESLVPCDVNLSGLLQAEELHAALAQLPHGVRLTVLMDVGTGGPVLSQLSYVLESHPNGGFSSKERKGTGGGSAAGDSDITVLYLRSDGSGGGRFDRENNLHGALSAAFMSVLNQAGDEGVTYEQLLTAMEAAVTRRVDRGEASTGYHPHAQGVVVGVASSQKVHPTDAFALGARATAAAQPSSPFSLAAAANPYTDDNASANKRAVLISCAYGGKLPGSDPALNEVHRMLQKMGFPADGVKVLTEQHSTAMPTKQNIVAFLRWLAQGSEPGDDLFLYFAGHSARLEPGPSSSGDAGVGLAPMDHHITGMLSGEELMFNLVSPLVSGVSLFCLFDTACTGTPAVLPYTMKVESDGGASFAHFPHVSRDQPAKALVQAVWTEPGKGPQAPVLPLNGQLTRSFLQTLDSFVGASTRTPKIGHVLQALGGRLEQAVPGSGHLPVYGSTRLFSEGDGFALMLNQRLAAAATPRRVAAAGPGGNGTGNSPRYGGGGPPGNHDAVVRAPVLQSPHNMPHVSPVRNGRHAHHPSSAAAAAATPYAFAVSGVRELDDNMAGIQRTLSEALSMSKHRSHSPISPRQTVASALGGGGGQQQPPPSAQSPIAPTTMRNLRLSNKDEPLGMRLNPLPPPENLGAGGAGMVVAMVTHGSAAFHAGIIPGDVVVRIASMPVWPFLPHTLHIPTHTTIHNTHTHLTDPLKPRRQSRPHLRGPKQRLRGCCRALCFTNRVRKSRIHYTFAMSPFPPIPLPVSPA